MSTHRCSCEQMHIRAVLCCAVVASGCSPARTRVRCGRACIHAEHRQRASDGAGDLIGINTAIYSPSGASAGIGFSIPVDVVRYVVPDLIRYGEIRRATIGADFRQFQRINGLVLYNVLEDGPADRAGVRGVSRDPRGNRVLGDLLVGINGVSVSTSTEYFLEMEKYEPGEVVRLNLIRDEREVAVPVQLGSSVE